MTLERSPIFAGEAFADHANRARASIQAEARNQSPHYNHSTWRPVKDRSQLLTEHTVAIPQITSKQARVRDNEVEYSVAFDGANGTFFRFRPSNEPSRQRPVGIVMARSLCLYTGNSGDTSSIKAELARQYEALTAWYEALCGEVEEFNGSLPGYIDEVFRNHEEDERKAQALEDELNS